MTPDPDLPDPTLPEAGTPDPLEAHVRESLATWAGAVTPGPGDPFAAMHLAPTPGQRRAWRAIAAGMVATAAAVTAVGVMAVRTEPTPGTVQYGSSPTSGASPPGSEVTTPGEPPTTPFRAEGTPTTTGGSPTRPVPSTLPGTPSEGEPEIGVMPTVVFTPADPAWRMTGFWLVSPQEDSPRTASYQFAHTDGRRFELVLYPLGSRPTVGTPSTPPAVDVRDAAGSPTDEGAPRYRITWDEAGRTWEADGEPFGSIDELARVLDGFRVVDDAEWRAWLPADLVAALDANPSKSFNWYETTGVQVSDPNDPPPAP